MGAKIQATCQDCKHTFIYLDCGTFNTELIRCTLCAETRFIPLDHLENGHPKTPQRCSCGGIMDTDVVPHCPKCHSVNLGDKIVISHYD